jgi:hypothetical protein
MNNFVPGGSPDVLSIASAFLAQVGARHLIFNFSDIQKRLISHPVTQALIMFGMFYLSTRRILFALGLLMVYYLFLFVLANEKHPMNVIPRSWLLGTGALENTTSPIDMYYENLRRLP